MSLAVLQDARARARHGRVVRLADTRHRLVSSDEVLLERVVGLLRPDAVEPDADVAGLATCLIEHTSALESWRDVFCSGPARIVDQPETGRVTIHALRAGAALRAGGLGVLVVEEAGPVACLVEPTPPAAPGVPGPNVGLLALILRSELLACGGRLVVHAGAVGHGGQCQIWTGPSGAGKTTQVLRLVQQGGEFYGDDQIVVGRDAAGAWRVWPDWRPPRVTDETCRVIEPLAFLEGRPASHDGKRSFAVDKVLGVRRPQPACLTQINVLVPSPQPESRFLAPGEAFGRVAPGFLHYLWPGHAARVTDIVLDLLATVPVRLVTWGAL